MKYCYDEKNFIFSPKISVCAYILFIINILLSSSGKCLATSVKQFFDF